MEIEYSAKAVEDILFWKKSGQVVIQKRITALIAKIEKTPFSGIGKPEPLKHNYTGYWSRKINDEHRLIYKVTDNIIYIASLKGHY